MRTRISHGYSEEVRSLSERSRKARGAEALTGEKDGVVRGRLQFPKFK